MDSPTSIPNAEKPVTFDDSNSNSEKQVSVEIQKIENTLTSIAKGLALVMNDPLNRALLKTEMDNSENIEKVIELKDFLKIQSGRPALNMAQLIDQQLNLNDEQGIDHLLSDFDKPLDLYFPVDDHRNTWKSDEPILVAVDPYWKVKNSIDGITAYLGDNNHGMHEFYVLELVSVQIRR